MNRSSVLAIVLALGPSVSSAYQDTRPAESLVQRLPPKLASFTCMQMLTDSASAAAAVADIKAANRLAAKAKLAARRAEKAALKARDAAIAKGLPPPPVPAPVVSERDEDEDRFHEGQVAVNLDPAGRPIAKYKLVRELSVPIAQIDRVIRPTNDTFAKRITKQFRRLIDANYLRAPNEMKLFVDDVRAQNITPAAKLALERVGARLAEHSADAIAPNGPSYLMRHVLKGRRAIVDYVSTLAGKAVLNEQTLLMHLEAQAAAPPPVAVPLAPAPTAAAPELIHYPAFNLSIPGLTTQHATLVWKTLGWGVLAATAFTAIFTPDPKVMLPLMVTVGGGLSFLSASVRNEVSGLIAHVRQIFRARRDEREIRTAADLLVERHERNMIQIKTLNEIAERLRGNAKEYGFAYYSYLAEVPRAARADGVIDLANNPFAETRLVRVEHVLYTDETSHYLLTFVTDAASGTVEMTNVALEPGA